MMRRPVDSGPLGVFQLSAGQDRFDTGGARITDSPFNAIDAMGKINPHLYLLGIPTETTRWFTQVGSGTPGANARFICDADAVARSILEVVRCPESVEVSHPRSAEVFLEA